MPRSTVEFIRLIREDWRTPVVELPDEDMNGRERPLTETRMIPHPNRSRRTTNERCCAENLLTDGRKEPDELRYIVNPSSEGRGDFTAQKEILGIRLTDDDLRCFF